ncbi:hypothetical protein BGZ68_002212 [Mortierella alpina]|nr:hypothetical protein BGZ68_002212 [Mortierella alpina]
MFVWQGDDDGTLELENVDTVDEAVEYNGLKFDLELELYEQGGEIVGGLNYSTALFDHETVERHVGYLESMLRWMTNGNEEPIGTAPILGTAEQELLLETWNRTEQPYPDTKCVHQLFENQVALSPEAIAIVHDECTLTYRELNALANRIACQLIDAGVKPGDYIMLLLDRSIALVASQIAVLKTGAAYVPIDTKAPVDRQIYISSDCGSTVLITDEKANIPDEIQGTVLRVQAKKENTKEVQRAFECSSTLSLDTAYVMYTSGSTGQPKGVVVHHRGIVRLVINNGFAEICPPDRMAFTTNPAFDPSTYQVWAPLLHGASIVVIDTDTYMDPSLLAAALTRHQVSCMYMTHGVLHQYAFLIGSTLSKLKYLLGGAEQGLIRAYMAVLEHGGPVRLVNRYGPTETTVSATAYTATRAISQLERLPIGRPISNTRAYVLDRHLTPVPIGVVGELHIGGAGVTHGYLNRPELTAERFLPDPFAKVDGARMYKTGDLAYYLPDGNLVFVGRNDFQVKIRGFRVELGEIEARLVEHPQVRAAVVLFIGEDSDEKRLVAYVVADPHDILVRTLREHLSAGLPEYMVPTAFVIMDVFPLNNNGKIDRRALPKPSSDSLATCGYVAPQGDFEIALATIWSDLLKVLGSSVNLEKSTPSAIVPVARGGPLVLSFAQQRLWFLSQMDGISEIYHVPLACRLKGLLNNDALEKALGALFCRHESLRTVFVAVDGQPQVQLLPSDYEFSVDFRDLRAKSDREAIAKQLAAQEAKMPFDLEKGPLVRAQLIQLEEDKHVFLMTMHHIVTDGWSIEVIFRELDQLYEAFSFGLPNPLPPLIIQYPDYAAWQRERLTQDTLKDQAAYWRKTLIGAPAFIKLPTDRPRPPQQSFAGASLAIRFDSKLTHGIKSLSQKHEATVFMTVLAAWSSVLSRLSGQDDIVIGTPSANRNHQQLEQLIGFFVSTLAIRIDLSVEPTAGKLLARVREATIAAQAHQDLPFEQVVEIVQPPRRTDMTPIFQVMFAWKNDDLGTLKLYGTAAVPEGLDDGVSKFDLELFLNEENGEIVGGLNYSTALFDHETIERHVGYLESMLRWMTNGTEESISMAPILGTSERELLLETWNRTEQPYPDNKCVHQLFEDKVDLMPKAIAVVHDERKLTYRELNALANGIACQLIDAGVRPGDYVMLLLDRSIALVASQIAVLKIGAAYIPIDTKAPVDRQLYIASDCRSTVLITDENGDVPLGIQATVLRISMKWEHIEQNQGK